MSTYRHIDIPIYRHIDISSSLWYMDISTYQYTDTPIYRYIDIPSKIPKYRHIDISSQIHGVRYNTFRARGHLVSMVGFDWFDPNPRNRPWGSPKSSENQCQNQGLQRQAQKVKTRVHGHLQSADLQCLPSPNDFTQKAKLSMKTYRTLEMSVLWLPILEIFAAFFEPFPKSVPGF